MKVAIFRLSIRALNRDRRSGELRVLLLALVISVAAVASVGFFTDRVGIVMERQASELIAADLRIDSSSPLEDTLSDSAISHGLRTARSLHFRSVVFAQGKTQLVELKAVDGGYPLRGQLRVSDEPYGAERATTGGPEPGTVWAEPRLLNALGLTVGDEVAVGVRQFRLDSVLAYEPDRGGEFFNIAPRLLMNLADIPSTNLVRPGSRVRYRLLVAGEDSDVGRFRDETRAQLQPNQEFQSAREGRPELRAALDRAKRFLGLAALVSVILAGVAIALSAQRFAKRHWDSVAVMRCFGATQATVTQLFVLEMLLLGTIAGGIGVAAGFFAQEILARILGELVSGVLPWPSAAPAVPALATGLVALAGFGLPPIMRLREVPPARVLRRDVGPVRPMTATAYAGAAIMLVALVAWQAADALLAAWVVGGAIVTLAVLAMAAAALVAILGRLRGRVGIAWRFGLANIARRGPGTIIQVVALGLGVMVLLTLTLVRSQLLADWEASLPADAPNHFLINIGESDVPALDAFLEENGARSAGLYPMIRGRLVEIDGEPVDPDAYDNPRAQRLAGREFNLSWAAGLQSDNRIVAGSWWPEEGAGPNASPPISPQISIETEIAETLGVELGDQLRFRIADRNVTAPVTSLRTVEWDSFHPNFFVIFPPGALDGLPATWITSFHLGSERSNVLAELNRRFPGVTIIDVDALMSKVREIIDRVVLAVEYVFLFTVLAGLMVLYAAIEASRDERVMKGAVLRTLGARKQTVIRSLVAELAALGLVAGTVAAVAASLLGFGLAEFLFGFGYEFDLRILLVGAFVGVVGVTLAGLVAMRGLLDQPPARVLREEV